MEPAEDRSRDDVLGRDTSDGRQPTRPDWWPHAKTAMGSAMIGQDGLENFDEHRGARPSTSDQPRNSGQIYGQFDLVPNFCGVGAIDRPTGSVAPTRPLGPGDGSLRVVGLGGAVAVRRASAIL